MKRDPGSSARKLQLRGGGGGNMVVSASQHLVEENGAKVERKGERDVRGGKERKRKIRGAKPDGTPGIYLDDSPACFARCPYETG